MPEKTAIASLKLGRTNKLTTILNPAPMINFDKSLLKEFDATINNDMIKIKSGNPENDLPIIIDILSKNKVSINQLKIDKASLEDVFIKLTGKKIS